jgi:hypothetical protein
MNEAHPVQSWAYLDMPGERSGVHPGAAARARARAAIEERSAASREAEAFSQPPYTPGCACGYHGQPNPPDEGTPREFYRQS